MSFRLDKKALILSVLTLVLASCGQKQIATDSTMDDPTGGLIVSSEKDVTEEEVVPSDEDMALAEDNEQGEQALNVEQMQSEDDGTQEILAEQASSEEPDQVAEQPAEEDEASQALMVDEQPQEEALAAGLEPQSSEADSALQQDPETVQVGQVGEPVKNDVKPYLSSKPVMIGGSAIERNGEMVNRYYFLRSNDTPQSVSSLIYGDEGHAGDLSDWNPQWKAGEPVYYISYNQPADELMKSFYEERNVQSIEYKVQQGDTLSDIARTHFGNTNSWKEIAFSNEGTHPDRIYPGSSLSLFPSDLSTYAGTSDNKKTAKNAAPQNPSVSEPAAQTQQVAKKDLNTQPQQPELAKVDNQSSEDRLLTALAESSKAFDGEEVAIAPRVETPNKRVAKNDPRRAKREAAKRKLARKKNAKQASTGMTGFIERNLILIFLGLGLMAVALCGYLILAPKREEPF